PLIEIQRARLAGGPVEPAWAASILELPVGAPVILIANELLDCLPTHQFVRTERGWAERMVGLDDQGELAFGLTALPGGGGALPEAEVGDLVEVSPGQELFGAELGAVILRQGGAALLIDYGRSEP